MNDNMTIKVRIVVILGARFKTAWRSMGAGDGAGCNLHHLNILATPLTSSKNETGIFYKVTMKGGGNFI